MAQEMLVYMWPAVYTGYGDDKAKALLEKAWMQVGRGARIIAGGEETPLAIGSKVRVERLEMSALKARILICGPCEAPEDEYPVVPCK